MKKILLPVLGAFALILGACANPGPDPVPPGTTYTITFKNYDGTVLDEVTVEHGGVAIYEGETPTREAERERERFVWTGWDGSLANIRENKTLTATYDKEYYIRFVNVPRPYETVLEGEGEEAEWVLPNTLPTFDDSDIVYEGWFRGNDRVSFEDEEKLVPLTIEINELDQWELQGWSYLNEDEEYENLRSSTTASQTGAVDLFPCYREDAKDEPERIDGVLEAKFINYDYDEQLDNYLYRDGVNTNNEEQFAVYGGETPTRPDDKTNSYVWLGWYVEGDTEETLVDLTSYVVEDDVVFVAKYNAIPLGETVDTFTVTFVNYDDTVLFVDEVNEGATAVYEGETPTRPDDDEYTYTFSGWDKTLTNVQSSFTTKATYTSTPIDTPVTGGPMVVYGPDYSVEDGLLLTLNTNQTDPNIASEYYAMGITLEQGDTFKLFDSALNADIEIDDYRNDLNDSADSGSAFYTGDVTLEGNVITVQNAGEYQVYLKTYVENDWIELWIPAITSTPDPNPPVSTADYYIVGEGSFNGTNEPWTVEGGIALEPNVNALSGVEYMSTGTALEEGDIWKIYDASNETYVTMNEIDASNTCAFGPVKDMEQVTDADNNVNYQVNVTGSYDIYYTIYNDSTSTPDGMWYKLYVKAVTTYVPPVGQAENYVVGSGSFVSEEWSVAGGVALDDISDILDGKQHHASITFEVGDQFKICSADGSNWYNNNVWENGEGSAFASGAMEVSDDGNILVNEAGTYDIYFKIYNSGYVSTWIALAA